MGLKSKRDERDFNEYPEELKQEYLFLSNWIRDLSRKYGQHILIKVIDAQSLQGFYKSIRYWVNKYPTFIINKKDKYTGKDKDRLNALLQLHLARI
mgnify:CR=1 FL=1